jgi:hypothetical protein
MGSPESYPEPAQVEHFQAKCSADGADSTCTATKQLSVSIGQRVRRQGAEEMWHAVTIHCREEADGTLVVRVVICNPDWEDALQIACLRSRPADPSSLTPLGANLDHLAIRIQRDGEAPGGEQSGKEGETEQR